MKQIKGLDTLRAFAVIFVIIEHWGPSFDNSQPILAFIKRYFIPDGQSGVDIFFVLSGFLITSILLQAKIANREGNQLFIIKNFMARRALRIFPIYYLLIFFLLLIGYSGLKEHLWYYLTYTSNIYFFRNATWGAISHTWSLAVEEQFYLFWPWVILFINDKYLKYVFIISLIIGIISGYITTDVLHKGGYPILLYNCMGCFGLGGFYAYAKLKEERRRKFERILLPFFVVCLFIYFHWKATHDEFWRHTTFLFRMVDGVMALQIIAAILNNRSELVRKYLLENRALNFIGQISYGIYLYHYVLQPIYDGYIGRMALRHTDMPPIICNYYFSYLAKFILLILISWLSFVVIEQPILKLKKRFDYRKK